MTLRGFVDHVRFFGKCTVCDRAWDRTSAIRIFYPEDKRHEYPSFTHESCMA